MGKNPTKDTLFIRCITYGFEKIGHYISYAPWTCILLSTLATIILSLKIPFTKMQNHISDFTPYGARSRIELKTYENFFSNRGEPKAIYAFIHPKDGDNLLTTTHFNETVQVLDKIAKDFYIRTPNGKKNFEQFCEGFCTINEPIRHFYSGMMISDEYINRSRHLDLGYPITTVLGTKLHMDPNLFGVKVAVHDELQREIIISPVDIKHKGSLEDQLPNNIRVVSLIVLQFRIEVAADINPVDENAYELSIIHYFEKNFKSDYITVDIMTENYITSEIVRAGLSLLPFLLVGFFIMVTFSCTTFSISGYFQKQLSFHKLILAVMACVCPFMACGVTMGGLFWFGFRFGSIMCVTPFLVLAIGVDDAYLMNNAWERITTRRRKIAYDNVDDEVRWRIVEMLVQTGPSVSITTITNMLAFGIGAFTPTPEIQLFSIGNAIAVAVDFILQLSVYAALMVVFGRYEVQKEIESKTINPQQIVVEKIPKKPDEHSIVTRILDIYCHVILNKFVSSAVLAGLVVYWYIAIVGTLNMKPELNPDRLFLKNSRLYKVFEARQKHIIPFYSVCWILVDKPGDITNATVTNRLHQLVSDFESLPNSIGRYSTKFWLRDYEDFLTQADDPVILREIDDLFDAGLDVPTNDSTEETPIITPKGNELKQFLEWPEFSFWKGFIQLESNELGTEYNVVRFFFTTAFQGAELVEWSNRAILLNQWRKIADKYPDMRVSIYEEDAKFLDLIETMIPISLQSALFTFVSMFAVAVLFISHIPTLFVATISILSTSVGVFGIMSLRGAQLDPIMMSATVMSIGFSVDIPSHISYHFHHSEKESSTVMERLKDTVAAVGFPIMQASMSTTLCLVCLLFVNLHMAQIFAECMLLVVLIGMIHGVLVIPVVFNLISILPFKTTYKTTPH